MSDNLLLEYPSFKMVQHYKCVSKQCGIKLPKMLLCFPKLSNGLFVRLTHGPNDRFLNAEIAPLRLSHLSMLHCRFEHCAKTRYYAGLFLDVQGWVKKQITPLSCRVMFSQFFRESNSNMLK